MLTTKRLLWRYGTLCQFNPLMTTNTSMSGLLIQQHDFARSATATKSATKKKTTTTSKSSKKKTASKGKGKGKGKGRTAAASKKSTKSKSGKSTKAKAKAKAKPRKVAKKKKAAPKPKSFIKSLSKSDQKLLKKYPDPARPKLPAPATYHLALEQPIMPTPKELGNLWRQLDEVSKSQYKAKRAAEMPEYRSKLADYKKRRQESVEDWLVTIRQLHSEKPPYSGYTGYFRENRSVFQGSRNFGANAKQVAAQWRALSEYEKSEYKTKYSELYREWKQRVASYYDKQ